MLEMVSAALPLLVSVTLCAGLVVPTAWLPKLRLVDDRLTAGAELVLVPLPDRPTDCGLPLALSVIVTAAVSVPVAVGVKVTLMVQLAPAARVAVEIGQVFV